jgi:hypothetical protein
MKTPRLFGDHAGPGADRRRAIAASALFAAVFVTSFALGRAVRPAGSPREATSPSVAAVTTHPAIPGALGNAPAIEIQAGAPAIPSPQPSRARSAAQSRPTPKPPARQRPTAPVQTGAPAAAVTPTSARQPTVTYESSG